MAKRTLQDALNAAMKNAGVFADVRVSLCSWGFEIVVPAANGVHHAALAERTGRWILATVDGMGPDGRRLGRNVSSLSSFDKAIVALSVECVCPRCHGEGYSGNNELDCDVCVGTGRTTEAHLDWLAGKMSARVA